MRELERNAIFRVLFAKDPSLRFYARAHPDCASAAKDGPKIHILGAIGREVLVQSAWDKELDVQQVTDSEARLTTVVMVLSDRYMSKRDVWHLHHAMMEPHGPLLYSAPDFKNFKEHIPFSRIVRMLKGRENYLSGSVDTSTQVTFRSASSNMFILIQVSSDLFEYGLGGHPYWHMLLESFHQLLSKLVKARHPDSVGHYVHVLLFARVRTGLPGEGTSDGAYRDYYDIFWEGFARSMPKEDKLMDRVRQVLHGLAERRSNGENEGRSAKDERDLCVTPPQMARSRSADDEVSSLSVAAVAAAFAQATPPQAMPNGSGAATAGIEFEVIHGANGSANASDSGAANGGTADLGADDGDANDEWDNIRASDIVEASNGNLFECLNIVLDEYDQHHLDRMLKVSGQSVVILTAGDGIISAREDLYRLTHQRFGGQGLGVSAEGSDAARARLGHAASPASCVQMICVRGPPLHKTPWVLWPGGPPLSDLPRRTDAHPRPDGLSSGSVGSCTACGDGLCQRRGERCCTAVSGQLSSTTRSCRSPSESATRRRSTDSGAQASPRTSSWPAAPMRQMPSSASVRDAEPSGKELPLPSTPSWLGLSYYREASVCSCAPTIVDQGHSSLLQLERFAKTTRGRLYVPPWNADRWSLPREEVQAGQAKLPIGFTSESRAEPLATVQHHTSGGASKSATMSTSGSVTSRKMTARIFCEARAPERLFWPISERLEDEGEEKERKTLLQRLGQHVRALWALKHWPALRQRLRDEARVREEAKLYVGEKLLEDILAPRMRSYFNEMEIVSLTKDRTCQYTLASFRFPKGAQQKAEADKEEYRNIMSDLVGMRLACLGTAQVCNRRANPLQQKKTADANSGHSDKASLSQNRRGGAPTDASWDKGVIVRTTCGMQWEISPCLDYDADVLVKSNVLNATFTTDTPSLKRRYEYNNFFVRRHMVSRRRQSPVRGHQPLVARIASDSTAPEDSSEVWVQSRRTFHMPDRLDWNELDAILVGNKQVPAAIPYPVDHEQKGDEDVRPGWRLRGAMKQHLYALVPLNEGARSHTEVLSSALQLEFNKIEVGVDPFEVLQAKDKDAQIFESKFDQDVRKDTVTKFLQFKDALHDLCYGNYVGKLGCPQLKVSVDAGGCNFKVKRAQNTVYVKDMKIVSSFHSSRDWFELSYDSHYSPPKLFHMVVQWIACSSVHMVHFTTQLGEIAKKKGFQLVRLPIAQLFPQPAPHWVWCEDHEINFDRLAFHPRRRIDLKHELGNHTFVDVASIKPVLYAKLLTRWVKELGFAFIFSSSTKQFPVVATPVGINGCGEPREQPKYRVFQRLRGWVLCDADAHCVIALREDEIFWYENILNLAEARRWEDMEGQLQKVADLRRHFYAATRRVLAEVVSPRCEKSAWSPRCESPPGVCRRPEFASTGVDEAPSPHGAATKLSMRGFRGSHAQEHLQPADVHSGDV